MKRKMRVLSLKSDSLRPSLSRPSQNSALIKADKICNCHAELLIIIITVVVAARWAKISAPWRAY